MDPKIAGWKAAAEKRKRKFALAMQRKRDWKKRWKLEPDFMRKNLELMIAKNRVTWNRRREKTEHIVALMPKLIPSWEFRNEIAKAIKQTDLGVENPTKGEIQKIVVRIRLYGLMRFDHETLCWHLAKTSQT